MFKIVRKFFAAAQEIADLGRRLEVRAAAQENGYDVPLHGLDMDDILTVEPASRVPGGMFIRR